MIAQMQVEIGSLSLVAGWEAQVYALQSAGIDLFVSAKQASMHSSIQTCGPECPSKYFCCTAVILKAKSLNNASFKDFTATFKVNLLQVFYLQNIEQGVDDLLDGLADIIFVRADLLENMQAQGLVTVSSFKVVAQVGTVCH